MPGKKEFKSAAIRELYDELIGSDPSAQEEFEQELVNIEVAQLIHDLRTEAGLSQRELARKVGTSASAINRLESNDYEGHTVAMVRRIASALNRRLEFRAIPIQRAPTKTASEPARRLAAMGGAQPRFRAARRRRSRSSG